MRRLIMLLLTALLLFGAAAAEEEETFTYRWGMFSGMGGTVEFETDREGRTVSEFHYNEADGSLYRTIVHRYDDAGVSIAAYTGVKDASGTEIACIERMYILGEQPVTLYLAGFLTDGYDVLTEVNYDEHGSVTNSALYDLTEHQGCWWIEKYDESGRLRRIELCSPDSFVTVTYFFHYLEEDPQKLEYVLRRTYHYEMVRLYPQYDEAGSLTTLDSEAGEFSIAFSHDAAGGYSGAAVHGEDVSLIFGWTKDEAGLVSSSNFTMNPSGDFRYVRAEDGTMQPE